MKTETELMRGWDQRIYRLHASRHDLSFKDVATDLKLQLFQVTELKKYLGELESGSDSFTTSPKWYSALSGAWH